MKTTSATSVDDLNAVLDATPFLRPYGFVVKSCAFGECALNVPFSRSIERPGGIVNGITIMGAADVAVWLAVMTIRGTAEHWVSADLKTAFLRPARQEDLLTTARIVKPGKRTMYATVDCYGTTSGLVAHHVGTYAIAEALGPATYPRARAKAD